MIILSDVHGKVESLQLCDVQIGDLANCVWGSADADVQCLQWALDNDIIVCIGNHEYPYFNPACSFRGFVPDAETRALLNRLDREGSLVPCYLHGDVLISHAGLAEDMALSLGAVDASSAATMITDLWRSDKRHPIFSTIGTARGGSSIHGGILWSDWREKKFDIKQVVGHTENYYVRVAGDSICIDVPPGIMLDLQEEGESRE